MWQWVYPYRFCSAVGCPERNLDVLCKSVLCGPKRLQCCTNLLRLMYAKPKEGVSSQCDDVLAAPTVNENMTHGGMTALLYGHRPRLVAHGFEWNGIGPKGILTYINRGLKIWQFCIVQRTIQTFSTF